MPALNAAQGAAKQIVCSSNLHQIGVGFASYISRHRGELPFGSIYGGPITLPASQGYGPGWFNIAWDDLINPDLGGNLTWDEMLPQVAPRGLSILTCPSDHDSMFYTIPHHVLSYARPRIGVITPSGFTVLGTTASDQVATWSNAIQCHDPFLNIRTSQIPDPSHTFAVVEFPGFQSAQGAGVNCDISWGYQMQYGTGFPLHHGRYNCLFHDGHVEAVTEQETLGTGTFSSPRGMWTRAPDD